MINAKGAEYEKQRIENINKNNKILEDLGLIPKTSNNYKSPTKKKVTKKKQKTVTDAQIFKRKSLRLQGEGPTTLPQPPLKTHQHQQQPTR